MMKSNEYKDRIIVALDKPSLEEAEALLKELSGTLTYFKVGFELFTAHGWKAVDLVKKYQGNVFLDLKLHDIPNTVKRALKVVCDHGIEMVNVHALGGFEMMKQAADMVAEVGQTRRRPSLIAVTILTSHSEADLKQLNITKGTEDQVLELAKLAKDAGMDGVVCSPREIGLLREAIGDEFELVTPGIRPAGSDAGDQKRICAPEDAFQLGASYIVVGRPINQASNPKEAALSILNQLDKKVPNPS